MTEDRLIAIVDDIIERRGDPCGLKGSSCHASSVNPCCLSRTRFNWRGRCPHLGPHGCTNVNIECKVWFCRTAISHMTEECLGELKAVEALAKEEGLCGKPFLGEPYVGADQVPL